MISLICVVVSLTLSVNEILTLISVLSSLLAVGVALYSVREARRTALNGTYFSEMASAYSDYLRSVSQFVFRRGVAERDALAVALYRLQLFASSEIASAAQDLYVSLLDWAQSNPSEALDIDAKVNALGSEMRRHLNEARKRGDF